MVEDQWQEVIIKTGIDTLLKYLSEHGKSSVDKISADIGVSEKRVKEWALILEKQGMLEIDYTIANGMMLEYTEDNICVLKDKVKVLDEELEDSSTKIRTAVKERNKELKENKEELKAVLNQFKTLEKEERRIKSRIRQIESLEHTIGKEIGYNSQINKKELFKIEEINQVIQDMSGEKFGKIEIPIHNIKKNIKAREKLSMILENMDSSIEVS